MQSSPKAHHRQTPVDSRHDARRVGIPHLTQPIGRCAGLLAGLLVLLPGSAPVLAGTQGQQALQHVQLQIAGALPVDSGSVALAEQKREHWLGGLIEVFAPVTPECETVPDKHAQQECREWERSFLQRWEQFKHEHPRFVAEVIFALVTFVIGILVVAS